MARGPDCVLSAMQQPTTLGELKDDYDVVVLGAGGAGLAAAVYAAIADLRVLVVESTPYVGGTTALSAGTAWVPLSHHAHKVQKEDSPARVKTYLDGTVGAHSDPALRDHFIGQCASALALIEEQSEVKYRPFPLHPDYESDQAGSTLRGRALDPLPFDGRKLGLLFSLLRPPIPEFTVLGGMMVNREDITHLLNLTGSLASFKYCAKILARHATDRLRYPRGTRLVMGNAHIARLLYSLAQHANAALCINTTATKLHRDERGVYAITLQQNGIEKTLKVRGGVVLASGGFNRNDARRNALLPGSEQTWCPGAPGHTGAAHTLAEEIGATYGARGVSHAFWAPVSLRKRNDGTTAVFPHFVMDRAKPGFITVNQEGKRFVNESTSYHRYGLAMQADGAVPAYLICDATALKKYGVGMVRPGAKNLGSFLADGYLTCGANWADLANNLQINPANLEASIARLNAFAASGTDRDFHRGETDYQRNIGDAAAGNKNANLGALTTAPFYAVKLFPGDIGAATGFATNANACALDANQLPIPGLYAAGNDMHSMMGGAYPAPGITIGPGLVFAYIAVKDIAARLREK
jgi:succinate dehydrogenase/fumarate reductase flavoprotein subunit